MNSEHNPNEANSEWKASESPETSDKEALWRKYEGEVEEIKDALGKGVDPGIKDLLIGMRAFDINTSMSCEGHEDWATGGPYVDIESSNNREMEVRLDELFDQEENEENEKEREKLILEVTRNNLLERKKIVNLLNEFYQGRDVPYEVRLAVNSQAWGRSRVESQGVDFQQIEENLSKKKENLEAFQAEMREFQEFVKSKFFSS